MLIKQQPSDFYVKEITNLKFEKKGKFSVFLLKKTNIPTPETVKVIARLLKKNQKDIGYAGNKDKVAVTEQYISIKNCRTSELKERNFTVERVGYMDQPISLGDSKGNYFEIVIVDLNKNEIKNFESNIENKVIKIKNYFGEQRFSKNNAEVGKLIVNKNFKKASELLKQDRQSGEKIKEYLKSHKNDYVGALMLLPRRVLLIYVHAYQSLMWNDMAEKTNNKKTIPLIGFATKVTDEIGSILKKEKIVTKDFIFKQIPFLTQEGDERDLFIELKDLKILESLKSEISNSYESLIRKKDKDKIKISFSLPKGSYATIVVKELFSK